MFMYIRSLISATAFGYILSNCQGLFQFEITAAHANRNANRTIWLPPSLLYHIPNREVISRERDSDTLFLSRIQFDVRESLKNRGWFAFRSWEVEVQLGDLYSRVSIRFIQNASCGFYVLLHLQHPPYFGQ